MSVLWVNKGPLLYTDWFYIQISHNVNSYNSSHFEKLMGEIVERAVGPSTDVTFLPV